MCFRPSAVAGPTNNMQQSTCPTCGMPVVAEPGVTSGECPYCGDPIPTEGDGPAGAPMNEQNMRIL